MWYIRKALEKGYLEHPGSACCTDDMFEIFVRFGQGLCSLLPLFVNRQLLCPHTHVRIYYASTIQSELYPMSRIYSYYRPRLSMLVNGQCHLNLKTQVALTVILGTPLALEVD